MVKIWAKLALTKAVWFAMLVLMAFIVTSFLIGAGYILGGEYRDVLVLIGFLTMGYFIGKTTDFFFEVVWRAAGFGSRGK